MPHEEHVAKAISAMFNVEQINELHARLGSAGTLPAYVRALKDLGVELRLLPGRRPFGILRPGRPKVVAPPVNEVLPVAETGQRETFLEHLRRHERRQTTYPGMSKGLAPSGIEKWIVDTGRMTITFYDKTGAEMLVEQIS